jgi:hypothetical protein
MANPWTFGEYGLGTDHAESEFIETNQLQTKIWQNSRIFKIKRKTALTHEFLKR